jgi:MarR family transcriptional regulator for hemolysin|tara:strand:- start:892 stop:1329 length:438 start_codon:yes stop_codon:yes gene_type:complete
MEDNFENNIGFLLHDVTRLMKRLFDKRMSTLNLTRSQWWVLNFLYFNEGINQSDFSILLDIEKAPLSRLLLRMEKKGWLERRSDRRDKRIKNLFLSKTIKPVIMDMRDVANLTREEALSGLNKKEQSILRDNLKKIKKTLSKMDF